MPIPLIVPVLNRFDLFTEMIESVDTSIRPYVLDNWRSNRGVAASWNEGMRRAMADGHRYAVITNDDVQFTPGALIEMYGSLRASGAVSMSANQNGAYPKQGITVGIDFFCLAVDMEQLVERCGWFDENFIPAYFEDNDMSYRMELAGAQRLLNTEAIVNHTGSATQFLHGEENGICSHFQFEKNRSYYNYKWSALAPGYEFSEHPYRDESMSFKEWIMYDSDHIIPKGRNIE
jgi:GT2 family glycosyltransferase